MNPVLYPAVGALLVLALDLLAGARDDGDRSRARAGLQLGSVAAFALVATALSLYWGGAPRYREHLVTVAENYYEGFAFA